MFSPPLWLQRRTQILLQLDRFQPESVCDIGTGPGSLLGPLLSRPGIRRIAAVDVDRESLELARKLCEPRIGEELREEKTVVELWEGSVEHADGRLKGYDAIVCAEVIEHLDPAPLESFPRVVLGHYNPRIIIVSTPNAEFNVNFPDLKYGTTSATLRIPDHRFEWTRVEFQSWATTIAQEYRYSVEFTGVGLLLSSPYDVGFCTQIATFTRLPHSILNNIDASISETPYTLYSTITFPYCTEPQYPAHQVLPEILAYLQSKIYNETVSICLPLVTPTMTDLEFNALVIQKWPVPGSLIVSTDELWNDSLRLRHICKSKEYLFSVISEAVDMFECVVRDGDVSLGSTMRLLVPIPLPDILLETSTEESDCFVSFECESKSVSDFGELDSGFVDSEEMSEECGIEGPEIEA
ncbi:hypothetical protein BCR33DRAFT_851972 [Rhizoclosmatium globosum]|uniref:Small RNA 2'-O-methyltransferase n=1 Tax=Rhizoclosmatium globosum TaxID=329046 RepID=A0A1Y2C6P4_9FUNG|nr:hypothetical protein BCR33DRAFT_851972 [Rhizoclosmatium globosum]|eukprot:ORY41965.1 hypothetical protein BCR33DRAFT_851972 [Rhizoclosmatium globosum]